MDKCEGGPLWSGDSFQHYFLHSNVSFPTALRATTAAMLSGDDSFRRQSKHSSRIKKCCWGTLKNEDEWWIVVVQYIWSERIDPLRLNTSQARLQVLLQSKDILCLKRGGHRWTKTSRFNSVFVWWFWHFLHGFMSMWRYFFSLQSTVTCIHGTRFDGGVMAPNCPLVTWSSTRGSLADYQRVLLKLRVFSRHHVIRPQMKGSKIGKRTVNQA